jgi:hypothetical protein
MSHLVLLDPLKPNHFHLRMEGCDVILWITTELLGVYLARSETDTNHNPLLYLVDNSDILGS